MLEHQKFQKHNRNKLLLQWEDEIDTLIDNLKHQHGDIHEQARNVTAFDREINRYASVINVSFE